MIPMQPLYSINPPPVMLTSTVVLHVNIFLLVSMVYAAPESFQFLRISKPYVLAIGEASTCHSKTDPWTIVAADLPQLLPENAIQEALAHVLGNCPTSDVDSTCRIHREQGAQLYRGSIQFGYFISAILRGLDLQGSGVEMVSQDTLMRYSQRTETNEAGLAANHRTACLFGRC
jgi:hypothetical protein